jgi:hypothetical protein
MTRTGPELKADTGAVAFESVELAHRGLTRARPTTADNAALTATAELANAANLIGGFF